MFRTELVSPDWLLLDPRNPRLFVDNSEYICGEDDDYSMEWVQDELLEKLENEPQHKLAELKHSIRTRGFEPFSDIYVRPYGDWYLVFEGNRRTASIKSLLKEYETDGLEEDILESISSIPVKILECPEDEMDEHIQRILTTLHLNPSLQWQPMQQAFQFYQMYLKLLKGKKGLDDNVFVKDNYYIRKLSDQLGYERKQIVPELQVYCLYKQLRDCEYTIDGTMYSMLKEVLAKRTLSENYFEFDYETYEMSEPGMDYLYATCLDKDRPITKPQQVATLHKCVTLGRTDLLDLLASHETDHDSVKSEVSDTEKEAAFSKGLEKIERELSKLIYQRPSAEETRLIRKILSHSENLASLIAKR